MKKDEILPLQQGDVLLEPVASFPEGLKRVEPGARGHVLAEGEATGHAHTLEATGGCEVLEDAAHQLWLWAKRHVVLRHEEHGHVAVRPGRYRVGTVRTVDPFQETIRSVRD